MSAQDILSLVSRLEAACVKRREISDQRNDQLAEFKRIGRRPESFAVSRLNDDLKTVDMEIAGLQGALDALKTLGGSQ